ncbi:MAG: competence protein ComFC [Acidimicrobiales bacterium]|jgi:competence protein ComFC
MTLDYKAILHFLFPLSEDEQILVAATLEDFLPKVAGQSREPIISLLHYSDAHVRSAIHLVKFHNHVHARKLLAHTLVTYLSAHTTHEAILVPVPLSAKRKRERGYNQVSVVIQQANLRAILVENILMRKKHTIPQTSLARTERLQNVTNAFGISNHKIALEKISGKHIVLIDDVTTTGATLEEAKAALLPLQPASVTCIALAH